MQELSWRETCGEEETNDVHGRRKGKQATGLRAERQRMVAVAAERA